MNNYPDFLLYFASFLWEEVKDGFSILKINGTTGYIDKGSLKNSHLIDFANYEDEANMIKNFIWYYLAAVYCKNRVTPMLSFAWERSHDDSVDSLLRTACYAIKKTDVLVVIGYSFPFFNREVDRKLLSSISFNSPLTIYIQDINAPAIIEKLSSVLPNNPNITIRAINSIDQFYLPPEL